MDNLQLVQNRGGTEKSRLLQLKLMEKIVIRKATPDDLPTLLLFEQSLINTERPFDPTLKPGDIHYYDIAAMITAPHIQLVVAHVGTALIGCGYARIEDAKPYLKHLRHAYLGFMYVEPSHRGIGVNKMIIELLKEWALSMGIVELRLDVYYDNEPALRAYEKAGFTRHMVEMRMGIDKVP